MRLCGKCLNPILATNAHNDSIKKAKIDCLIYRHTQGDPMYTPGNTTVPFARTLNQRAPSANPHQFRKIHLSYSRFFLRPVTKNATNTEVANRKGSNPGKALEPLDPDEVFPDELLPELT